MTVKYTPTGLQFRQTYEILKLNTKPANGDYPPTGSIYVWMEVDVIGSGHKKSFMYRDETGDRNLLEGITGLTDEQITLLGKIGETTGGDFIFNGVVYQAPKPLKILIGATDVNDIVNNYSYTWTGGDLTIVHNLNAQVNCNLFDLDGVMAHFPVKYIDDNTLKICFPLTQKPVGTDNYTVLIGFGASLSVNNNNPGLQVGDINSNDLIALIMALN